MINCFKFYSNSPLRASNKCDVFRDLPISVAYENYDENLQIMGNFDFLAICDSTLSETVFYYVDLWISNLLEEMDIERYNLCSLVIVK